jgi:hypothetical protein
MSHRIVSSDCLRRLLRYCIALLAMGMAAACTPHYDWREVHGAEEPFVVLFPAKPTSFARPVKLDGSQVLMRMTAAQVDGVTFAVGSATMADANDAQAALAAMKSALVSNINGTIRSEAASAAASSSGGAAGSRSASISVEASGTMGSGTEAQPAYLKARFVARERRVYQAVILSRGKPIAPEIADPFLTSFKTD